jgi:hypothetical protein
MFSGITAISDAGAQKRKGIDSLASRRPNVMPRRPSLPCHAWVDYTIARRLEKLPHAGASKEFFGAYHRILQPGLVFDLAVKIIDLQIRIRRYAVRASLEMGLRSVAKGRCLRNGASSWSGINTDTEPPFLTSRAAISAATRKLLFDKAVSR